MQFHLIFCAKFSLFSPQYYLCKVKFVSVSIVEFGGVLWSPRVDMWTRSSWYHAEETRQKERKVSFKLRAQSKNVDLEFDYMSPCGD